MGVIRSDPFILVSGDVVSNMDLRAAIDAHRKRRAIDKNTIMTSVFTTGQIGNRIRPLSDDLVIAMNATTQKILHYVST